MALFIAGLFLYSNEKRSLSTLKKSEIILKGRLSDYPEEKENSVRMNLRIDANIDYNRHLNPLKGSIILYCKKDSSGNRFLPGDIMIVRCTPVGIASRGNPYEFDYRFYMENHNIRYYAFIDSSDILSHQTPGRRNLKDKARIIRERIIEMFRERGINGERLALVAAITLGQKNMLDPEQKLSFMKAGVMHIMAVSGLHAVILSLFVYKLLFFLKGRLRILRILITLLLLWSFAFVTGLTSSVLRAALMYSFLQAGQMLKRPANGLNSVLASAFVLIMIRASVIFDAGFLLSYSAVIFIISFYRDLYEKIRFKYRIPDLIWQSAAVTIIAQAGTLPLTIMLFNRFPTWFILSNIIIVPVASLVIVTGCLVPLTYHVTFLSKFLAGILDRLTGLTELLTEKVSSLPFSTIENIGLTTVESIFLAVTIFLLLKYLLKRKSISVLYPLTGLLFLFFAGTVKNISTGRTNEIIVYNNSGNTAIGVRTGRILNLYSDSSFICQEAARHCAALNLRLYHFIIPEGMVSVKAGEKNMIITGNLNSTILKTIQPDIVVFRGKVQPTTIIFSEKRPEALIFTNETYRGARVTGLIRSLRPDTVHFVRNDGAYTRKLYLNN
jgi:competence protein ComEC